MLKALVDEFTNYQGMIKIPNDVKLGYIPQLFADDSQLSGGELFNKIFLETLEQLPDILLLDEPTNHLDQAHRQQLMEQVRYFYGTVIAVTHDVDFMQACFNQIWHIDRGKITVFSGKYHDYHQQLLLEKDKLNKQLKQLNSDKKKMHQKLMQEQKRAAKSSAKGAKSIANKKWATVVSHAKARCAQETSGKKKVALQENKSQILDKLNKLNLPQTLVPTFYMPTQKTSGILVQINHGNIAYKNKTILSSINMTISTQDKIVIQGDNGSGKTTLIKAIMQDPAIIREGEWLDCDKKHIGYLDQHYRQLPHDKTILEALQQMVPHWGITQSFRHLADFLFKGKDTVNAPIAQLSGGEKARLSLALIAARPPKLLILDEITNNVDLVTIDHLLSVLYAYPGAMLLISHYQYFLDQLPINKIVNLEHGKMIEIK